MVMVEAGSEYENKQNNGISHFLEHMVFKGTKNRPNSLEISKEFDGMGSDHNAFTANEITAFYGRVANKHFDNLLDIISDLYLNPTFPEAEMEKEKGVIIEEINHYEDLPQRKVHDVFQELMYGDTPFGWSITGPKENIKSMKIEDFISYRKIHYVSAKTTVVVSGDINPSVVFKKIEKVFKDIPNGKAVKKIKFTESQKEPKIKIVAKNTDQSHLVIGFRSFDMYDKRNTTLKVLSTILGSGMSSRLFQKMREELGICYYVWSGVNDASDHGNFIISAGVDSSRVLPAVNGILDELRKILVEKVTKEELKKAKDYIIGNMYLHLESSSSLARFYGFQEVMREKIKTPKQLEKEIESVTVEDIRKLSKTIFVNKNMNMAIVGNVKNGKEIEKNFKI
jgi:predicted Zn-dependent peptidase